MHVVEDMVGKQGESKWAEGVGHRGEWVCASKFLVFGRPSLPPPPLTLPPFQRTNIRAEGQRMVEVQRETYSEETGTVGRVPDAQMQRGAMPHFCQKLGATFD